MSETTEALIERVLLEHEPVADYDGELDWCRCDEWHGPDTWQAHVAAAIAEALAEGNGVPPGPCWHASGATWPNGVSPRCELRAGHAGAHECDRGSMYGTAVWTDDEETR